MTAPKVTLVERRGRSNWVIREAVEERCEPDVIARYEDGWDAAA